jgi:hypothetical protein
MAENIVVEQISDETLLSDIANTRLELDAYTMLIKGYNILKGLPENVGKLAYKYQSTNFWEMRIKCKEFLTKLETLALDHNLEIH